jgi:hypothetical protein
MHGALKHEARQGGAEQPVLKKSQIKGKIDQQGKNRGDCGRMQAVKLSGMVATV